MGDVAFTLDHGGQTETVHVEFDPGPQDDESLILTRAEEAIRRDFDNHPDRYAGRSLPPTLTLNLNYREPRCWVFRCDDRFTQRLGTNDAFYNTIQRLLSRPSQVSTSPNTPNQPAAAPTSSPRDLASLVTAPGDLTPQDIDAIRTSHPVMAHVLDSLLASTTFVDLRTPEQRQPPADGGAPPPEQIGLFERVMALTDQYDPGIHPNRSHYRFLFEYLRLRDQHWSDAANNPIVRFCMGGQDPLYLVGAQDSELLAIERLLDRVPHRPGTQAEKIWTVEDPSLHTWLRVPDSVTPRPVGAVLHSRFAVAFHNFRILLQLVQSPSGRLRVRDMVFRFRTPVCDTVKNDNEQRSERRRHFNTFLRCSAPNGLGLVEADWSRFESTANVNGVPPSDIQVNQGELDAIAQYVSLFGLEPPSALFSRTDGQLQLNLRPWPVNRARENVAALIYVRNALVEAYQVPPARR